MYFRECPVQTPGSYYFRKWNSKQNHPHGRQKVCFNGHFYCRNIFSIVLSCPNLERACDKQIIFLLNLLVNINGVHGNLCHVPSPGIFFLTLPVLILSRRRPSRLGYQFIRFCMSLIIITLAVALLLLIHNFLLL